jgi:hypothetical protein
MSGIILRFVTWNGPRRRYHRKGSSCGERQYRGTVRKALEVGLLPCRRCHHHPANCLAKGMFGYDCRGCDSGVGVASGEAQR